MKICVIASAIPDPQSFQVYKEYVFRELTARGAQLLPSADLAHSDLVWDPAGGGARVVDPFLRTHNISQPVVVTLHGTVPFSAPRECLANTATESLRLSFVQDKLRQSWQSYEGRLSALIAVSSYSAGEIQKHLGIPAAKIRTIHHGASPLAFGAVEPLPRPERRFFLHVASDAAVKNTRRLLAAFAQLPVASRPPLVMIVKQAPSDPLPPDVTLVTGHLPHRELGQYYASAVALIFPSLEESFGLPVIEAMSCGCPVITSSVGGCAEVAGDAALLVDPYSTEAIRQAMSHVCTDTEHWALLRDNGLARAAEFTWDRSGDLHFGLFASLCRNGS